MWRFAKGAEGAEKRKGKKILNRQRKDRLETDSPTRSTAIYDDTGLRIFLSYRALYVYISAQQHLRTSSYRRQRYEQWIGQRWCWWKKQGVRSSETRRKRRLRPTKYDTCFWVAYMRIHSPGRERQISCRRPSSTPYPLPTGISAIWSHLFAILLPSPPSPTPSHKFDFSGTKETAIFGSQISILYGRL